MNGVTRVCFHVFLLCTIIICQVWATPWPHDGDVTVEMNDGDALPTESLHDAFSQRPVDVWLCFITQTSVGQRLAYKYGLGEHKVLWNNRLKDNTIEQHLFDQFESDFADIFEEYGFQLPLSELEERFHAHDTYSDDILEDFLSSAEFVAIALERAMPEPGYNGYDVGDKKSHDVSDNNKPVIRKPRTVEEQRQRDAQYKVLQNMLRDSHVPAGPFDVDDDMNAEIFTSSFMTIEEKQAMIKTEFLHAYSAYEQYSFGDDELRPLSKHGSNGYHMGLTMIDALDTMILMNLTEQVTRARAWIATPGNLRFDIQEDINVFETTIRVLGGLLSSYALTHDNLYKEKAYELGKQMLVAFDTPTGLPYGTMSLKDQKAWNPEWCRNHSSVAEVGSLSLEFTYLSEITGDMIFKKKIDAINKILFNKERLFPQFIDPHKGSLHGHVTTLGSRTDSIYEYMLKQYIQTKDADARDTYVYMMDKLFNQLLAKTGSTDKMVYITEQHRTEHGLHSLTRMDHLVCFVPGMLFLGAYYGQDGLFTNIGGVPLAPGESSVTDSITEQLHHIAVARSIMKTCYTAYARSPTGLAPEIYFFEFENEYIESDKRNRTQIDEYRACNLASGDFRYNCHACHNILRPETLESLFVAYRVSGEERYRDQAWAIFLAFVRYARVPSGGYASLKDVRRSDIPQACLQHQVPPHAKADDPAASTTSSSTACEWDNWNDKMESFFLSETLKYLYLMFSPKSYISLSNWVFNTEAHPFPRL